MKAGNIIIGFFLLVGIYYAWQYLSTEYGKGNR